MLNEINKGRMRLRRLYKAGFAILMLFAAGTTATFGQSTVSVQTVPVTTENNKSTTAIVLPVLTEYKKVKIGTTADQVREALGKAKIDNVDGFYYQISDDEFTQIRVDKDKKVQFIAVTYTSDKAPKFEDVFGKDMTVAAKADGSVYHLVNYPEAGYWVAYSRTAGEKPTVTVTMQML